MLWNQADRYILTFIGYSVLVAIDMTLKIVIDLRNRKIPTGNRLQILPNIFVIKSSLLNLLFERLIFGLSKLSLTKAAVQKLYRQIFLVQQFLNIATDIYFVFIIMFRLQYLLKRIKPVIE